jgi:hypothetical protein
MDQSEEVEQWYEFAVEDFNSAVDIGAGSEPSLKRMAQGLVRLAQAQRQHHRDVSTRLRRIEDSLLPK